MIKGLIGEKLGHSYSKVIHEKINDDVYNLYSLSRTEFDNFFNEKKFDFVNVTIPYKQDVIKYLDDISDTAKKIGAVNLVVNNNGKLSGYNTDYYGFKYMLDENSINPAGKKCLILGTGGTSKTVYHVLNDLGAKEIYKASRNKNGEYLSYDEVYDYDFEVIVNTTPVGMYPNINETIINLSKFSNLEAVIDCIYNPLRTKIILDAEKLKIKAVNGLLMLVFQAVKAHEIAYNVAVEKSKVKEIYSDLLDEKRNIVLIGMPGCGKSTIGNELSLAIGKQIVDMDNAIINKANMNIPSIFEKYGEDYFRSLETEVAIELAKQSNLIISTGGGVIKKSCNIDYLKANGVVIYIERDLEKIVLDNNRPLSKSIDDLKKLFDERKQLYESYCDYVVENNSDILNIIEKIKSI